MDDHHAPCCTKQSGRLTRTKKLEAGPVRPPCYMASRLVCPQRRATRLVRRRRAATHPMIRRRDLAFMGSLNASKTHMRGRICRSLGSSCIKISLLVRRYSMTVRCRMPTTANFKTQIQSRKDQCSCRNILATDAPTTFFCGVQATLRDMQQCTEQVFF